jgi:DNA-binding response OmpR family regulator
MQSRLKVLLVEDEPPITILYEQLLEATEFDLVAIAPCNSRALTWLQSNRPDLAIVDFFLADGPCIAVMTQLEHMMIPLIVVTAFGDSVPDHVPAERRIRKPIRGRHLTGALRRLVTATMQREHP